MLDFKFCAFLRPPVKSFFSILFYHGEWISNEYLIIYSTNRQSHLYTSLGQKL